MNFSFLPWIILSTSSTFAIQYYLKSITQSYEPRNDHHHYIHIFISTRVQCICAVLLSTRLIDLPLIIARSSNDLSKCRLP